MDNYKEAYEQAIADKRLKTVTPNYVEFKKKGDQIVGQFVGKATVVSSTNKGEYNQYIFDTDDGMVKFAMGQATDKEVGQSLKQDSIYVITFNGQEKLSGARTVNKFVVEEIEPVDASETSNPDDLPF